MSELLSKEYADAFMKGKSEYDKFTNQKKREAAVKSGAMSDTQMIDAMADNGADGKADYSTVKKNVDATQKKIEQERQKSPLQKGENPLTKNRGANKSAAKTAKDLTFADVLKITGGDYGKVKEWLASHPDYKAGDKTNAWLAENDPAKKAGNSEKDAKPDGEKKADGEKPDKVPFSDGGKGEKDADGKDGDKDDKKKKALKIADRVNKLVMALGEAFQNVGSAYGGGSPQVATRALDEIMRKDVNEEQIERRKAESDIDFNQAVRMGKLNLEQEKDKAAFFNELQKDIEEWKVGNRDKQLEIETKWQNINADKDFSRQWEMFQKQRNFVQDWQPFLQNLGQSGLQTFGFGLSRGLTGMFNGAK